MLERLPEAVEAAAGETVGVPEKLLQPVTTNVDRLASSLAAILSRS